jgi:succinylglutamate desuccinylase
MTKEHGLLFRTYVPILVACLEDADSEVREMAKQTVSELFQYTSACHLPSLFMTVELGTHLPVPIRTSKSS